MAVGTRKNFQVGKLYAEYILGRLLLYMMILPTQYKRKGPSNTWAAGWLARGTSHACNVDLNFHIYNLLIYIYIMLNNWFLITCTLCNIYIYINDSWSIGHDLGPSETSSGFTWISSKH